MSDGQRQAISYWLRFARRLLERAYVVPVVLGVAVVVRLLAVFAVGQDVLYSDGADYYDLAVRLLNTGHYASADMTPTAYRPVGYSGALAVLFWVFGPHVMVAQLANVVAQATAFGLLWDLARKTVATELQARVAVLLLAVHPNSILSVAFVQTESLALLFTALTAWALLHWRGVLAGLAWGVLVLVKPPYLILLPCLMWYRRSDLRRTVFTLAIASVVGGVIWGSWSARNSAIAGHTVFVSSNAGANLRVSRNPGADGSYGLTPSLVREFEETAHLTEWEQSDVFSERALDWLAENPTTEATLIGRRLVHLWIHDTDAIRQVSGLRQASDLVTPAPLFWGWTAVSMLFYGVVLLCAGGAMVRSPRLVLSPFVSVAVIITLVHMAFFGSARFHFVPLLFLVFLVPLVVPRTHPPAS